MKLENEQRHVGKEDPSASEVRRLLRKNYEELNAVMVSGYLPYLNPAIITRMKAMLGNK